eukprot:gb/GECH01010170.1/.p1 GENE.gb/GECH01010170.1/~~gb/GECH01010170.1/.p1  ORF type:complete len:269 (+),score=80.40 gb/GECH01010170.1/:1-807(+)
MVDYSAIVQEVKDLIKEKNCGPILVRLSWHDAGTYDKNKQVGGPHGTVRCPAELGTPPNAGLEVAVELLQPIKDKHPDISYADFYSLAAVTAIKHMDGPAIQWHPGRSDNPEEKAMQSDMYLPDGAQGSQHLRDVFYRMGFDDQEIVALSGAHTLGRCRKERSGFDGFWTHHPFTFNNEYFKLLLEEDWKKTSVKDTGNEQFQDKTEGDDFIMMLPSDMALREDSQFRKYVDRYAQSEETFFKDFAAAFQKLQQLGWEGKLQSETVEV